MHGGAAVGLGEDEQLVLAGLGAGVGGQPVEGRAMTGVAVVAALAVLRVGAQDAEAGAGHGGQHVLLPPLGGRRVSWYSR